MDEWIQAQLAAGLPAFAGTAISGTVVINQELINELLARWVAGQGSAGGSTGGVDLRAATRHLKQVALRAETGRLALDFRVEV
jgi:hypothetical protein